jgi:hypothetical protein
VVILENQILKATEPNIEERIVNTLLYMKANGKKECTIKCIGCKLCRMQKETDLNNPQTVQLYVATLTQIPKTERKGSSAPSRRIPSNLE